MPFWMKTAVAQGTMYYIAVQIKIIPLLRWRECILTLFGDRDTLQQQISEVKWHNG